MKREVKLKVSLRCKSVAAQWVERSYSRVSLSTDEGLTCGRISHKRCQTQVENMFSWPALYVRLSYERSFTFPRLPSLCHEHTHTHTHHSPPPRLSPFLSCLSCLLVPGLASLFVLSGASMLHLCCLSCQLTWPRTPCKITHTQTLGFTFVCVCAWILTVRITGTNRAQSVVCVPVCSTEVVY